MASRIVQRIVDDRDQRGARTTLIHLQRNFPHGYQGTKRTFRRPAKNGWAYQGFNYPKAAWGGQLRDKLASLEGKERSDFVDAMGGTNTAPRASWKEQLERGAREGFYRQQKGTISSIVPNGSGLRATIKPPEGGEVAIDVDFIIDATGLEAKIEEHRVLNDLLVHVGAGKNPKGRLDVEPNFMLRGVNNGAGRIYDRGRSPWAATTPASTPSSACSTPPCKSMTRSPPRGSARSSERPDPSRNGSNGPGTNNHDLNRRRFSMTPVLFGRIQTRLFLLAFVGGPLAFLLAAILPRPTPLTTYNNMLRVFFGALVIVAVVGVIWELIYHGIQQFRWEKDWPTLYGLITAIPEGIVVYLLLDRGIPWEFGDVPLKTFLPMFIITWLAIWAVASGPLRIAFPRWRFRGGRFF